MTSDFQTAFSKDATREQVSAINERLARAEGLELYTYHRVVGREPLVRTPNPLADYVGDHRNVLRLREKAIAEDADKYAHILELSCGFGFIPTVCAPVWAMALASCLTLEDGVK